MIDDIGLQAQTTTLNFVIRTWSKKQNAESAQSFFDRIFVNSKDEGAIYKPNRESFVYLLEAWSRSKSPLASQRAETALSNMKTKWKIEPDAQCLLRVIECWSKSKRNGTETRIESLVSSMKRKIPNHPDPDIIRAVQEAMWNVLHAHQVVRNAHRAEEMLLDFATDHQNNKIGVPPTIEMCLSVLSTWSKSKSTRRAYRAEKLLKLMEKDGNTLPKPTVQCYTAVLNCFAGSHKTDSAQRCEALLRRMDTIEGIQPNLISLTCVLIAWARSEDLMIASKNAERIFQEIQSRGMEPDRFVYAGLITAWGRNASNEDSIIKVEEYFQRLKDAEKDTASSSRALKLTVVEYTATIQAYANYVVKNVDKSRMAVARVETLLDEMLDSDDPALRPNALTYAAVLKTIASARRLPNRGDKADTIMKTMYNEGIEISPYIVGLVKKCNVRDHLKKSTSNSDANTEEVLMT
jgi:hypothetical protein